MTHHQWKSVAVFERGSEWACSRCSSAVFSARAPTGPNMHDMVLVYVSPHHDTVGVLSRAPTSIPWDCDVALAKRVLEL